MSTLRVDTLETIDSTFSTDVKDIVTQSLLASSEGASYIGFEPVSTLTNLDTFLKERLSVFDYGAVGDGTTDDTNAIGLWLAAKSTPQGVPYANVYMPAGKFVTNYSQSFEFVNRWDRTSLGLAVINSREIPFGDILSDTTIYVGPTEAFTSISSALQYLKDRRILAGASVTIQVADGTYDVSMLVLNHPDGGNISILGNTTDKTKVVLTADMSNNQSCFYVGPGFSFNTINGFTINGINAWQSHGVWAANASGAGIATTGGTIASVGPEIVINKCYYFVLSDRGGKVTCQPGVSGDQGGDTGFHARWQSYMQANQCTATNCSDSANGLGSGFGTEGNSFLECRLSTAMYNDVSGVAVSGEGCVWAHGMTCQHNGLYGAVNFGGLLVVSSDGDSSTGTNLSYNNQGLMCLRGDTELGGSSAAPILIYGNNYEGIRLENDGTILIGGTVNLGVTAANGGIGIHAVNGARAALNTVTYGTNTGGNTETDTGNNSNIRVS